MVVPESNIRFAPTTFIRQLVERLDPCTVVVSYDWVSGCLLQGQLLDIDTYRLRSSPHATLNPASRSFNQYHPSDLISIELENLTRSMDPIKEAASAGAESMEQDYQSDFDCFSPEFELTQFRQKLRLDMRNPPLIPTSSVGHGAPLSQAKTDDQQDVVGHSPNQDRSFLPIDLAAAHAAYRLASIPNTHAGYWPVSEAHSEAADGWDNATPAMHESGGWDDPIPDAYGGGDWDGPTLDRDAYGSWASTSPATCEDDGWGNPIRHRPNCYCDLW